MATEQTHNAEILWAQRSNEFDEEKVSLRSCRRLRSRGGLARREEGGRREEGKEEEREAQRLRS